MALSIEAQFMMAANENTEDSLLANGSRCVSTAIRKAARRATQFYDKALAGTGLRSTQFAILAELKRAGNISCLGDLADLLVLERSALGHSLRPLEREGLVVIRADGADKRKRIVEMTREGLMRHAATEVKWRLAQESFVDVIGPSRPLKKALAHMLLS
ncbi:MarR family winged helix-turn-helix transcriptional regulator [Rhizobium sp. Rhizsp82]|uniref:MarR family winged helix-turn-helix transcriptional regulator n=1 Tax=Rhizobium sp. Rhizsp82 TaxID=3243057 RepID=UPI0039B6544C